MATILLAEDERDLAVFVGDGLREAGFSVEVFGDGDSALDAAGRGGFDVVILDIMLPGRDGLSVLKALREAGDTVPVVIVTARGEAEERVAGLELGADDYLVKPFYLAELIARVRSVLRRASGESVAALTVADLALNQLTREVVRAGQKLDLTTREFQLLALMMRSAGRVLTRTQILEQVWDYHFDPGTNIIESTVRRLRAKVDAGFGEALIETLRGVGYRLREGGGTEAIGGAE